MRKRTRNTKYSAFYAAAAEIGYDCDDLVWQRGRWRLTAYRSNGVSVKIALSGDSDGFEEFGKTAIGMLKKFALTGNAYSAG